MRASWSSTTTNWSGRPFPLPGGHGPRGALAGDLAEGRRRAEAGVDVIYLDLDLPDGDGQRAVGELPPCLETRDHRHHRLGKQPWRTPDPDQRGLGLPAQAASPHSVRDSLAGALAYPPGARARGRGKNRPRPWPHPPHRSGPLRRLRRHRPLPAMLRAMGLLRRAADREASVCAGRDRVGKELAARAIHANSHAEAAPSWSWTAQTSPRPWWKRALRPRQGAFTGAHSDRRGLVAEADGGTLFLDEVGELPCPCSAPSCGSCRSTVSGRWGRPGTVQRLRLVAATTATWRPWPGPGNFARICCFGCAP
jgi:two-component system NtrC family response regulator